MKDQRKISLIKSFLDEIDERLFEQSPETLQKVASTLGFALHWMDKADEAKAEVLNAEFIG